MKVHEGGTLERAVTTAIGSGIRENSISVLAAVSLGDACPAVFEAQVRVVEVLGIGKYSSFSCPF